MSFPRYSSYKDSGFEWLGRVPAGWDVGKFRHLFRESAEKIDEVVIGPMLSVSGYRGIEVKDYDDDNRRRTDDELVGYRIVRKGQLVVNTMWLNYAGLGVSSFEGHVSPAYRAYAIADCIHKPYVHHLLRSGLYVQGYTRLLTGIRPNSLQMSREDLMDFPVLTPPIDDQVQIAAFLDHETAKIDALIAEQQRLIELLNEKRQAVISQAVTKGLNSDAPMKDSGIDWLGDVPEHWQVIPVWLLFEIGRGRVLSHEAIAANPGEYPVYSSQTEGDGEMGCIDTYDFDGDYLTWTTDGANAGTVFRRSGKFNCTNVCGTLKPRLPDANLRYFHHALSACTAAYVRHDINPKLMNNVMAKIRIAVPPQNEQDAITAYLDAVVGDYAPLIEEANRAIVLLGERRVALVSSAVTGQIDVRGLVRSEGA